MSSIVCIFLYATTACSSCEQASSGRFLRVSSSPRKSAVAATSVAAAATSHCLSPSNTLRPCACTWQPALAPAATARYNLPSLQCCHSWSSRGRPLPSGVRWLWEARAAENSARLWKLSLASVESLVDWAERTDHLLTERCSQRRGLSDWRFVLTRELNRGSSSSSSSSKLENCRGLHAVLMNASTDRR